MKPSRTIAVGVLGVGALVGAVFAGRTTVDTPAKQQLLITPRPVERRTLSDVLAIQGEVRREETQTINSAVDGKVSSVIVDDGDTVNVGDSLFALDGRTAVAVNGDFAFFRSLDVGSDGPDVQQLEAVLAEANLLKSKPDQLFTEETRVALGAWQLAHGYGGATPESDETISVSLSQNGAGYDVGKSNTVSFTIGASVPPAAAPTTPPAAGSTVPATAPPTTQSTQGGPPRRPSVVPPTDPPAPIVAPTTVPPTTAPPTTTPRTSAAPATPTKPTIQIEANVKDANEGDVITFTVTSDIASNEDITVDLTIGGEATAGQDSEDSDFLEIVDSIVLPAGQTSISFDVPIFVDSVIEDSEDLTVGLSDQFGNDTIYIVGPRSEDRVVINSNGAELTPILSIEADTLTTDESGSVTFTVTSTVESNQDLDVFVQLSGSARAGDDYVAPEEDAFTIAAGDTSVDVDIQVRSDSAVENDERLVVSLLGGSYAVGGPSSAEVIIESDDVPELSLAGGGLVREGESTGFVVQASEALIEDTSVNFQIGGTAQQGSDFDVLSDTIIMKAGTKQLIVPIKTIDDDVVFQPADMLVAAWPARIGTVSVDEGEFVLQGNPVLSLTEPSFSITLSVSASDRAELVVGQKVSVDFAAGDQILDGQITELDESATIGDDGSETYEGVVTVSDDVAAVDGATVTIDVTLAEAIDVLAVPVASIVRNADGDEVRVINDQGTIERRKVTIGLIDDEWVEIKEGFEGNELVIVDIEAGAEPATES